MKYITAILLLSSFAAQAQTDSTKKPIPVQKFKVWSNGASVDATSIDVDCVQDDLATFARFYYVIKDSTGAMVATGNVEMRGADYKAYITQNNHADRATAWVMQQLKITRRTLPNVSTTSTKSSTAAAQ